MLVPTNSTPPKAGRVWQWRRWLAICLLLLAFATLTALTFRRPLANQAHLWAVTHGFLVGHSYTGRPSKDLPFAARNWLGSLVARTEVPQLTIDIRFRHFDRLRRQRRSALVAGILEQGEDDFVPARIRLKGVLVRAKLRLKGDLVVGQLDHDSWSFRVHIRDEKHLFGMRRFNLQPPRARDYHSEPLFLEHVRHIGVLAPRYKLVRVALNGDDLGVMAIEEHFSKELLESQDRREGVVLKIDESRYFSFHDREVRRSSPFSNFLTGEMTPFRLTRVSSDPSLASNHRVAVGLYRAFVDGSMAPSEVFDAKLVGRFLAVVQTWSAWHAASWRNIRFYYNPITARLEPIAYDAELLVVGYHRPEPLHRMWLADPRIRANYVDTLRAIAEKEPWSLPEPSLNDEQKRLLRVLHRSFPFLKPIDIASLADTAAKSISEDPVERVRTVPERSDAAPGHVIHPGEFRPEHLAWVHLIEDGDARFLELGNLVDFPVAVSLGPPDGRERSERSSIDPETLALLPPTRLGELPSVVRIALDESGAADRVFVSPAGSEDGAWVQPTRYFSKAHRAPVPRSSLEAVSTHEFLEYDPSTRTVSALPGSWDVTGSISLPKGVALVLRPGTELRFQPEAALIVRGATRFSGTHSNKVVLRGKDESGSWRGLVVFNSDSTANWSFVRITGTSGVQYEDWQLTGGVTVYEGLVTIENTEFLDTTAEDSLNLVRTNFALTDVVVREAVSDGLDIDFGAGTVKRSTFSDIGWIGGGDGLDFSGCSARVKDVEFSRIADKAISVGERSQVRLESLTLSDVGFGVVGKDGSYLDVGGAVVEGVRHAVLMSYTKKPEFGGAALEAADLVTRRVDRMAVAQNGSLLRIDGVPVETTELDVDLLYATLMKKGNRE